MTIQTLNAISSHTGNGSTVAFTGTFQAKSASQIMATVDNVVTPVTVAGDTTVASGWTATFSAAPALGASIRLYRVTPRQQLTEYTPYGRYQAVQHEDDYDYLLQIEQETVRDALMFAILTNVYDANAKRITNVASPVGVNDAATKEYVDTGLATLDTTAWDYDAKDHTVNNVLDPLAADDAATKNYVDVQLTQNHLFSDSPDMLLVGAPAVPGGTHISARVNLPLGLVQLNASGKVAPELIPASDLAFIGLWDASGGVVPPAASHADIYIVSVAGTLSLPAYATGTPTPTPVTPGDYLTYMLAAQSGAAVNGWYWVEVSAATIIASQNVTHDPSGTRWTSTNVKALAAEISTKGAQLAAAEDITGAWQFRVNSGLKIRPAGAGVSPTIGFYDQGNNRIGDIVANTGGTLTVAARGTNSNVAWVLVDGSNVARTVMLANSVGTSLLNAGLFVLRAVVGLARLFAPSNAALNGGAPVEAVGYEIGSQDTASLNAVYAKLGYDAGSAALILDNHFWNGATVFRGRDVAGVQHVRALATDDGWTFSAVNAPVLTLTAAGTNANAKRISNVGAPTATTDAATKAYVDAAVAGAIAVTRAAARVNAAGATVFVKGCTISKTAVGRWQVTITGGWVAARAIVQLAYDANNVTSNYGPMMSYTNVTASGVEVQIRNGGNNNAFTDAGWSFTGLEATP